MNKKQVNVRELLNRSQEISARVTEIADACEKENREQSPEEQAELAALYREQNIVEMKLRAASSSNVGDVQSVDTDAVLRERLINKNAKATIQLMREVTPQTTAALAETGIIPVAEQEIMKPIRTGLIWDKLGIPVRSGLVGTLRWPSHTKATAQWAGEAEALVDAHIDFDKLNMTGTRLGIAIPVTREELENSVGVVENVIKTEAPAAVVDKINEAMFATNGTGRKVYGPLVKAFETATEFASLVPTRKELLKLKAEVAKKIGTINAGAWVMTENMKAELEDTKVDAGSGRFVCEGGMILGYPVYTTDAIADGLVAFGDWSYQAAGFFGQTSFIADPYTLARKNSVDFVLNSHFGTVTLREEAFVIGKAKGFTAE